VTTSIQETIRVYYTTDNMGAFEQGFFKSEEDALTVCRSQSGGQVEYTWVKVDATEVHVFFNVDGSLGVVRSKPFASTAHKIK
jgi:hypothetical protein